MVHNQLQFFAQTYISKWGNLMLKN